MDKLYSIVVDVNNGSYCAGIVDSPYVAVAVAYRILNDIASEKGFDKEDIIFRDAIELENACGWDIDLEHKDEWVIANVTIYQCTNFSVGIQKHGHFEED